MLRWGNWFFAGFFVIIMVMMYLVLYLEGKDG